MCMPQGMKVESRIKLVNDLTCVVDRSRLNETSVLIDIDKVDHVARAVVDAVLLIVVYH